jgi:4-diphosphocytidyl-2-C-methyl-D-erythritol kinase
MFVTEFASAKINLALHVLGRRADGYHELDSVVAFASVGDVLTLEVARETSLTIDGPFSADLPLTSENLVLKAHAALAAAGTVPAVLARLTKNLPVASGIGGGSADAAAALRGIVRLSKTQFDPGTLNRIALSLGADVPVCLFGKACRMQGVGDIITALEGPPASAILLVNPLKACSTADVFRGMGLNAADRFGAALDVHSSPTWRNDMTKAAIGVLPDIETVLQVLKDLAPAATVRMSGSGATCFALFDGVVEAQSVQRRLLVLQPTWWAQAAHLT